MPAVAGLPAGELGRVFDLSPGHVGIDTIDDPVGQITSSHHWTLIDGHLAQELRAVPLRLAVRA